MKPIDKQNDITGIILAGGMNSRMGRNKALVVWNGKSLLQWVYEAVKPLCNNMIISSNEDIPMPEGSLRVPDIHPGTGPIAGIESGLFHSTTEMNIIVSCDTPALSEGFFSYMIQMHKDFDISIPIHNGINEPLIGVYNRSVMPAFQKAIESGLFKPPAVIRSCRFQEVPVKAGMSFYKPEMFLNLNSPQDLKRSSNEKN